MNPTAQQLRDHLCIEFGLSITQVIEILRTPTHPAGLRDQFATSAMQGMLSDIPKSFYGTNWKQDVVNASYCIADAMLAERSKNG